MNLKYIPILGAGLAFATAGFAASHTMTVTEEHTYESFQYLTEVSGTTHGLNIANGVADKYPKMGSGIKKQSDADTARWKATAKNEATDVLHQYGVTANRKTALFVTIKGALSGITAAGRKSEVHRVALISPPRRRRRVASRLARFSMRLPSERYSPHRRCR